MIRTSIQRPKGSPAERGIAFFRDVAWILAATLATAFFLKLFVLEAFQIPSVSMANTLQVGDYLLVNKLAYGFRAPQLPLNTAFVVPSFRLPIFHNVRRGDVIVFEYPGDKDEIRPDETMNYIKRCVGLPGDTIEIREGELRVNGLSVHNPVNMPTPVPADDFGPVVIPSAGMNVPLSAETLEQWRTLLMREGHTVAVNEDGQVIMDGLPARTATISQNYYFVLGDNRMNSRDSRHWGFVPEGNIIGEALLVYWSWEPAGNGNRMHVRWDRIGTLVQ